SAERRRRQELLAVPCVASDRAGDGALESIAGQVAYALCFRFLCHFFGLRSRSLIFCFRLLSECCAVIRRAARHTVYFVALVALVVVVVVGGGGDVERSAAWADDTVINTVDVQFQRFCRADAVVELAAVRVAVYCGLCVCRCCEHERFYC